MRSDPDHGLLARERMLATLSHEIRTPLNGVLGMAGLLGETRLDRTQAAYLKNLRDCGEHLLALVNDVLDYAKLDAQPVRLEPSVIDVEILLQGVCELLSPRAYAAGVEIAWATRGRIPSLYADDGRLRQILFNLTGNAVKMTKTGGVLLCAEGAPDEEGLVRLRLEVKDTGPGVPAGQQADIFNEFVQTDEGVAAGGAGLGLAIVRRLADAFDGELGVENQAGGGARFWFSARFAPGPKAAEEPRLPLTGGVHVVSPSAIVREAAAHQIDASGARALPVDTLTEVGPGATAALVDAALFASGRPMRAPVGVPALILLAPEERKRIPEARAAGFAGYLIKPLRRKSVAERLSVLLGAPDADQPAQDDERVSPPDPIAARILLAEDNPVNALLASALLTRSGCRVQRVVTGEEAIAAVETATFDLILMDVRMPGMNGMDATRTLRTQGVQTPIVALTANVFDEDRRACLDAGMNDFLTKPLDPRALQAVLTRWAQPGLVLAPAHGPTA